MLLLLSVVAPFESEEFDEPEGFVAVVESVESEVSDEPEASPALVGSEGTEPDLVLEAELVVIDEFPLKHEVLGTVSISLLMTIPSSFVSISRCLIMSVCVPAARL